MKNRRNTIRGTAVSLMMIILTVNLLLFGSIGYLVYSVVSDPDGAAETTGTVIRDIQEGFYRGYGKNFPPDTTDGE